MGEPDQGPCADMDGRLARPRPGRSPYVTIHKIFWQSGQWHAMPCPMLKVPRQHPKRGRLGLTDGSCSRRRPEYRHHVWAYDWVAERTHDGRPLKILTVVAAYSRACLALVVARRLRTTDVLETLATCSSGMVSQLTPGPTTARRSRLRSSGYGSSAWTSRGSLSNRGVIGRISDPSTCRPSRKHNARSQTRAIELRHTGTLSPAQRCMSVGGAVPDSSSTARPRRAERTGHATRRGARAEGFSRLAAHPCSFCPCHHGWHRQFVPRL